MSRLVATVTFGRRPTLGAGIEPIALAHGYAEPMARFLGYDLTDDGNLDRVPGAYAPVLDDRPSVVTDLLLALAPELSSIADRIQTLDTKSRVNYGVDFREKAFDSAVGWGSDREESRQAGYRRDTWIGPLPRRGRWSQPLDTGKLEACSS